MLLLKSREINLIHTLKLPSLLICGALQVVHGSLLFQGPSSHCFEFLFVQNPERIFSASNVNCQSSMAIVNRYTHFMKSMKNHNWKTAVVSFACNIILHWRIKVPPQVFLHRFVPVSAFIFFSTVVTQPISQWQGREECTAFRCLCGVLLAARWCHWRHWGDRSPSISQAPIYGRNNLSRPSIISVFT